jgi:hypothetical protein
MKETDQDLWDFFIYHAGVCMDAAQQLKRLLDEGTPEWQEKWRQSDKTSTKSHEGIGPQKDRQSLRPRCMLILKGIDLVPRTDLNNMQELMVLVYKVGEQG